MENQAKTAGQDNQAPRVTQAMVLQERMASRAPRVNRVLPVSPAPRATREKLLSYHQRTMVHQVIQASQAPRVTMAHPDFPAGRATWVALA